jgi:hypothetical protein
MNVRRLIRFAIEEEDIGSWLRGFPKVLGLSAAQRAFDPARGSCPSRIGGVK